MEEIGVPKRRGRAVRIALLAAFGIFGILILSVLLAPTFLSSGPGLKLVEGIASGRVAGSISFDSISLSWRRAQEVKGLVIRDADGITVLAAESMVNGRSLWGLLRTGRQDLGTTTVSGLEAHIVSDAEGDTNLMKALRVPGPAGEKKTGFVPVLPFGSLVLGQSLLRVSAPGIDPVVFDFRNLQLALPGPDKPLEIDIDLQTRQGELAGELKVRGLAEDVVDSQGRLQPLAARIDLEVLASNLPLQGIDGLLGYGGLLSSALGRQADLSVRTRAELTKADFELSFSSPNLKAGMKSTFVEGTLSLTEGGDILYRVTPAFVAAVAEAASPGSLVRLAEEAPIRVSLEDLRIPVMPLDFSKAAFRGGLQAEAPLRFSGLADGADLLVRSLGVAIEAPAPVEKIAVDLTSDLLLGDAPGSAHVSALVSSLFDQEGRLDPGNVKVKVDGKLKNIPTAMIDVLPGREGLMKEIFGPALDAHFSAGNPGKGKTALELFVESGRFEADMAFVIGEKIELARPARVQARLTPRLLDVAAGGKAPTVLNGPADVNLSLTGLSVPLPADGTGVSLEEVGLGAVVSLAPAGIAVPEYGIVNLAGTRVEVKVEGLDTVRYTVASSLSLPRGEGAAASLAGQGPVSIQVIGETGLTEKGEIKGLTAELKAASDLLESSTSFRIDPAFESVEMTAPLEMKWSATAEQVREITKPEPGSYGLGGGVQVTVRVEPTTVSLKDFTPEDLKVSASALVSRMELVRDGRAEAVVDGLGVKIDLDGGQGKLTGSARASASLPGKEGAHPVEADIVLEKMVREGAFDLPGSTLALTIESRGLPTAMAGLFMEKPGPLIALAGEQADLKAAVRKAPLRGGTGEATIRLEAERLETAGELTLGATMSLKKPLALKLTLTPESFAALRPPAADGGDGSFVLARPAVVTGEVTEFRLPADSEPGLGGLSFSAALEAAEFLMKQKSSGRNVGLQGLSVTAVSQGLAGGLSLSVRGGLVDSRGSAGKLDAEVRLAGVIDGKGGVDLSGMGLKMEGRAEKVPAALMDGLLGLGGLAEAALGQSLDLSAAADMKEGSGPLTFKAAASHARLDVDGSVQDGVFVLKKPIVGEIDVTEQLGRQLLNKIHPIFETVKTSEEPLHLEIDSRGFAIPLKEFHVSRISMPRLTVGANKMILSKGGTLEMLVRLAQQFGGVKGLGSGKEMEVWFTPLVARMANGTFEYSRRLDLLIDGRLHALSWGSVALAGGSSYDLKLGLPAASLRKILGTKKISEGEIFTLPLKGMEGKVDTKDILASGSLDLGRVRGQYELAKKDPLLGLLAGELAKKAIGTETGPVPPPSVTPLPWAGLVKSEPEPPAPPPTQKPVGNVQPAQPKPAPKREPAKPKPEEIIKDVLDLFK